MIRSTVFAVVFYGLTGALVIVYLPLMLLPQRAFARMTHGWVRLMMAVIRLTLGIRHELRGADNIPDEPVIFASKHQSAWDVLIFNFLLPDCVYVLKRELYRIPFWGWYVWRTGSVAVDRTGGARALKRMVADATRFLEAGRPIVLFPQGTRTPPGERRPYLPGAAALYKGTGRPVVPVALNSGMFWPRRTFRKRPGVIVIEFLPPIAPGLNRREFLKELERRIEAATDRLEAEAVAQLPDATAEKAG